MKRQSLLLLCAISLVCFINPALCQGENWTNKGSFFNSSLSWFSTYSATFGDPVAAGTAVSGIAEFYSMLDPNCNTASIAGQVTSVTAPATGYAEIVERRYTHSATVSGSLSGTFVGSCFDYNTKSIINGPSSLAGIIVGQVSWELAVTSGDVYRGTAYYYFKNPGVYSDGRMEGDLQGKFYWKGFDASGHPLAVIYVTSIRGTPTPATFPLNLVYDNPIVRVWEPNITHSNIQIDYRDIASSITYSGCISTASTHSGTVYYLPLFNIGHYSGTWQTTTYPDNGSIFSYNYKNTTGINDVVPRLIGLTQASAEDILKLHGFVRGSITAEPSSTYPTGRVISQSVDAGSLLNLGTPINLVVANSVAQQVMIPNVVGMTQSSASGTITGAGLAVGKVSQVNDSAPAGQVISQNPAGGTSSTLGSSVSITVSLGPVAYTLSTSVIGGNGTVSPSSGSYSPETQVSLMAVPNAGYQVKAWSGTDNDSLRTTSNTVTMNASRTVTVEFEPISGSQKYSLDITVPNGHGTLSADPSTGPYVPGTVVTLTATPDSGYILKAWHGTDNDSSKANSNTVTMSSARTVSADFEESSNSEENKSGGGGGGCFISCARTPTLSMSGLIHLLGVVFIIAACFVRMHSQEI